MIPIQILPHKKFYTVTIHELIEKDSTQHFSQISKIWHVEVSRKASDSYISCRIETFRRKHEDNKMLQSEKDLWKRLAMINDDITLMLNASGQMEGIVNWKEIKQKAKDTCKKIRQTYKGPVVDKLLDKTDTMYENSPRILQEFEQYKQFGLLTSGLYNCERAILKRIYTLNVPEDPSKMEIQESFTKKPQANGLIHFTMQGNPQEHSKNMPQIKTYTGEFILELETTAMQQAAVEIEFSGKDYRIQRKYQLRALSDKDIEYL